MNIRIRAGHAIGLLAACLLSFSCGYRLRGTGSYLPPHIKKICVPMFKNMTTRFELDVMLTQAVINELTARAKIDVAADKTGADAILLGEITTFSVRPISFSGDTAADASADRYNITITVKLILRDLRKQKALYSNPALTFVKEYEVPQKEDFESHETEAIGKVADEFGRTVVANLLEGF